MARKPMTDEQRAIARENLAKGRAARAAKLAATTTQAPESQAEKAPEQPKPQENPMHNVDYAEILRRLNEVEQNANFWRNEALKTQGSGTSAGPQAGQQGLIGTFEKYLLDPAHYPDPRARLSKEPRLQRFAFDLNYELAWLVGVSSYKTIDGVNTREPKFTIELNKIVIDEDTGEQTNGRYTICRAIFHEDPEAALIIAREQGIDVKEYEEKAFLDEMRYLRIRDWLLEAFYPPKPSQEKKNKKDMVIGGKLVEYFEINSESTESVPFAQLSTKL